MKLVKDGTLKAYPGLSHGLFATHPDLINADLLAFAARGECHRHPGPLVSA
jgi:non-heme chloroperoxidase